MEITVKEVSVNEIDKLENLMQLYLHDLSYYFPIDFNSENCKYNYDLSNYFKTNKAYFISLENKILGFILVDINSDNIFELSEMFVLNNYKRNNIGSLAAKQIFNLYKGGWVIKAVPNSIPAEKFWEKTVKSYTNNKYKILRSGKYNRVEIYFDNN